jgi:hypothetical protein
MFTHARMSLPSSRACGVVVLGVDGGASHGLIDACCALYYLPKYGQVIEQCLVISVPRDSIAATCSLSIDIRRISNAVVRAFSLATVRYRALHTCKAVLCVFLFLPFVAVQLDGTVSNTILVYTSLHSPRPHPLQVVFRSSDRSDGALLLALVFHERGGLETVARDLATALT